MPTEGYEKVLARMSQGSDSCLGKTVAGGDNENVSFAEPGTETSV